jgi:hypothetical protein
MSERIPNFVYGANYRAKSRYPSASAPRFNCFTPANPDIPAKAYVADCWVCDAFGRIDPGLNVSPVPVRKEDLGRIINTLHRGQRM